MVVVCVVNSTGNIVKSFDHDLSSSILSIDLSNEPKGLYFIQVSYGGQTVNKKISLF